MDETSSVAAPLIDAAETLARRLTADQPALLRHLCGVAAHATALAPTVAPDERESLIAAAWLHDIGKVPALRDTGMHSIDGARYLRREGWPPHVCDLVAYHSGSRFVAELRGLTAELCEFDDSDEAVTDALTAADQTTGQNGADVELDERMADMLARHSPDSPSVLVHPVREVYLRAATDRVHARAAGLKVGGS
ncbi:HD domain-containing protein [Aldersonia kunmingensis]|uniref:HD domain-containing protein n=1 Tax=Aldersonia kunmingensis TaxID=408066 RepID=UPI00082E5F81|nr:HD domain-containing protein [Aldersonia kunmingensis]